MSSVLPSGLKATAFTGERIPGVPIEGAAGGLANWTHHRPPPLSEEVTLGETCWGMLSLGSAEALQCILSIQQTMSQLLLLSPLAEGRGKTLSVWAALISLLRKGVARVQTLAVCS